MVLKLDLEETCEGVKGFFGSAGKEREAFFSLRSWQTCGFREDINQTFLRCPYNNEFKISMLNEASLPNPEVIRCPDADRMK